MLICDGTCLVKNGNKRSFSLAILCFEKKLKKERGIYGIHGRLESLNKEFDSCWKQASRDDSWVMVVQANKLNQVLTTWTSLTILSYSIVFVIHLLS